ncbi:MAG: helix-turn-helix domain-containing protein [Myxococcales bacterium]|nr:helix-turn-helix domain-containing protein [Myxococcales bacterium]
MRRHRASHTIVQRARIILLAHQGLGIEQSARQLSCSSRNVRKWKARFIANPSVRTLEDQKRSGRAAQVPFEMRCKLVPIACERPAAQEPPAPFRDIWT